MLEEITAEQWLEVLPFLDEANQKKILSMLKSTRNIWDPLPGPQTMAYESEADIVGYGGAAGGGKTDLAVGKALTQHQKVMILRRVGTELTGIEDRIEDILGSKDGYNGQKKIWRINTPRRLQIEFASLPNAGDEKGYQGRPHDLLVFDEAANFLESQVRFLLGWLRSTDPKQKCQALMCFNPPTSSEGRWIIAFFAPWLDDKHPNPALPGELRYFATVNGEDMEVPDRTPFVIRVNPDKSVTRVYDFKAKDYKPTDIITPLSRTFIPSRISDNPHLFGTGYMNTLQALPEPLRSQMLNGDFRAGMQDSVWQLCPTAWVDAAMDRWKEPNVKPPMDSMGIDVARGGQDNTIIARRHGMWFDRPLVEPGKATPDGHAVAAMVLANQRDNAVQHIDVIGVGASPYDILNGTKQQVVGVDVRVSATVTDKSGMLQLYNMRSQLGWLFREALDPANNTGIALPPDKQLRADLCAIHWSLQGKTIKVESREDTMARIKRSPDWASAYFLALIDTPKLSLFRTASERNKATFYDPYAGLGMLNKQDEPYDPYKGM